MKILINPFEKYSETSLLITGIVVTLLASYLGYYFNTRFDGLLHSGSVQVEHFYQPLLDHVLITLALTVLLFGLGRYINNKTRFVDILNTTLIARLPMFLTLFDNWNGFIENLNLTADPATLNLTGVQLTFLLIIGIIALLTLIWFCILVYNGFKTATNLKLTVHKVAFCIAVLVADVISRLLIAYITY